MIRRRVQLGLVHVAVTMTAVPIQSALSRVMVRELGLPALLVAFLTALPYLFSPLQVAIGSFTDRHPLLGRRRTPAILAGLALCALGMAFSPVAVYAFAQSRILGFAASILVFGAWGIGFNLASVSYFSLASELSGEHGRSRTIAVMFFLMIVSIIFTSAILARMLDPYTPAVLSRAFARVAAAALALGLLGTAGLEPRLGERAAAADRTPWRARLRTLSGNRQALLFFLYLVLMLAPLLGQDILLAPFGGLALSMSVRESTGITSVWGTFTLIGLIAAGLLEGRVNKRGVVVTGSVGSAIAYLAIIASGFMASKGAFYAGVSLLGLATGLATVSNLSLMLDMTVAGKVGLFMGAWGMADAIARLFGNLLSGAVRDLVSRVARDPVLGYSFVFVLLALMLAASLVILPQVDSVGFRKEAEQPTEAA